MKSRAGHTVPFSFGNSSGHGDVNLRSRGLGPPRGASARGAICRRMADSHPAEVAGSNAAPPNRMAIIGTLPINRVAGLVRTVDPGVSLVPVRSCTLRCTPTFGIGVILAIFEKCKS